jgi:hypothetical protein
MMTNMGDSDITLEVSRLANGHVALVACTVLYLVWWWIFFKPGIVEPTGLTKVFGIACILGAVVCGIVSIMLIVAGISALPVVRQMLPGWTIGVAGFALYLFMLLITTKVFERPPTTELILIVGWVVLEAYVINALVGAQYFSSGTAVAVSVLVATLMVASTVCYVLYYRLDAMPSFIDGMVPLISVGVSAVIMVFLLLV